MMNRGTTGNSSGGGAWGTATIAGGKKAVGGLPAAGTGGATKEAAKLGFSTATTTASNTTAADRGSEEGGASGLALLSRVATNSKAADGGWGVEKGAIWRPTMLPTPPPPPLSLPQSQSKKGKKSSGDGVGVGKSTKAESAGTVAAASDDAPVVVRKDDLMKALLKKLTPYFAIVAPNGKYLSPPCLFL
jgi:hypothetical protein